MTIDIYSIHRASLPRLPFVGNKYLLQNCNLPHQLQTFTHRNYIQKIIQTVFISITEELLQTEYKNITSDGGCCVLFVTSQVIHYLSQHKHRLGSIGSWLSTFTEDKTSRKQFILILTSQFR